MTSDPSVSTLPHACVVHLGFSGSRDLFPGIGDPQRRARFAAELARQLKYKLQTLHANPRLQLHEGHFFVGIAQMAIGGDWAFADACHEAGLQLRAFLPQTRDEFLHAPVTKPESQKDFTPEQRIEAERRLERASVIQERVASVSPQRSTRFVETSAEILRIADIAVTLQPEGAAQSKPGGTGHFAERARILGKPVYALTIFIDEKQQLHLREELTLPADYRPPQLPAVIGEPALKQENFAAQLKDQASAEARRYRQRFESHSWHVVWTHVGATTLAALALAMSYVFKGDVSTTLKLLTALLLGLELFLLGAGFLRHRALHDERVVLRWTDLRLIAEIARSTRSFRGQHHYLAYLFTLSLPEDYAALTRTLNVVHLRNTRAERGKDWQLLRDSYLQQRLRDETNGQIDYFRREFDTARRHMRFAARWFTVLSLAAFFATTVKLIAPPIGLDTGSVAAALLSCAAIVLPVLAVGFLSHAAVLDREARASIYADMKQFLDRQARHLQQAGSEPEFLRLQTETEMKLLSETLNWYWRRRFINPA